MLEPIFGATGAVVVQYVFTLIIILGLIGLLVWLVRRYASGGLGTSVRGRLPRLAIVDALVVDNRHRLVLVRRDNVEHLLLIGGATDLLVEPSIVRTRVAQRPGQPGTGQPGPGQPSGGAPQTRGPGPVAVPPPAPPAASVPIRPVPPPEPAESPIPFQPRPLRNAAAARPVRTPSPRPTVRPAEAADLVAPRDAALRRPAAEPEAPLADEPELAAVFPARMPRPAASRASVDTESESVEAAEEETPSTVPDIEPPAMTPVPASAFAPPRHRPAAEPPVLEEEPEPATEMAGPAPEEPPAPAPRVSELEKEMARLLGEISSSRSS